MSKFSEDQIVTRVDYRINAIASFTNSYYSVVIDMKDHPYYHCIPIDDCGGSLYIPEKLLIKYKEEG